MVLARTVCLPSAGNSALARFPDRNQVGAWAADAVAATVGIPGEGPHVDRLGDVVMVPAPTGHVREAGNMSIKFPNLKRFFSLFLAAVMMVSLLAVNAHAANANKITDYGDAYGHWAYEALAWAVDNGVLVGTSEDKLNPDGYLRLPGSGPGTGQGRSYRQRTGRPSGPAPPWPVRPI